MYFKSYDQLRFILEYGETLTWGKKTIKAIFTVNELKKKNFMHFMHLKHLMNIFELKKNTSQNWSKCVFSQLDEGYLLSIYSKYSIWRKFRHIPASSDARSVLEA